MRRGAMARKLPENSVELAGSLAAFRQTSDYLFADFSCTNREAFTLIWPHWLTKAPLGVLLKVWCKRDKVVTENTSNLICAQWEQLE